MSKGRKLTYHKPYAHSNYKLVGYDANEKNNERKYLEDKLLEYCKIGGHVKVFPTAEYVPDYHLLFAANVFKPRKHRVKK